MFAKVMRSVRHGMFEHLKDSDFEVPVHWKAKQ
jgi:hypothetical protein